MVMAVSTILMLSVVTIDMYNLKSYHNGENQASLNQDTILLIQYLRNQVMFAGGGSVRPWMGIWVENNCARRSVYPNCGGSDRLTVVSLRNPPEECSITSQVNPTTFQIAFSSPGVCCLTPSVAGEINFANQQVMLTLSGYYTQRFVTNVDPVACQVTLQPGLQAGGNDSTGGTANWTGGMMSLVNVETIYMDPTSSTLNLFVDANNNGTVDAGELTVIADQVYDLQFALGYAANPPNGNVTTTANGVGDEWLYNAPSVAEAWGTSPFVAPLTPAQLSLVYVGVAVGSLNLTNPTASNTVNLLDGPARSAVGWTLQAELSQVAPRNSFIFQ